MFGGTRYANVTSTLALIVALGGTGYAAVKLPADSVGTQQIRRGAVRSSEVRDGSLRRSDFVSGQLPGGPKGQPGPKGDAGPKGETGPAGPQGPSGVPRGDVYWAIVDGSDASLSGRSPHTVSATRVGAGEYLVVFDRDITDCVFTGTLGRLNTSQSPGEITVSRAVARSNGAFITTYDSAGMSADRSFYVLLDC